MICVGAGKFVAVGTNGTVLTSSDGGQTWTARTAAAASNWSGLAFNGSVVVAVGVGATSVMTSADLGVTWTARTAAEVNSWLAVTWAEFLSLFIAVAFDGTHRVMTSPDGITWTARTASSAQTWSGIAASDNLVLAVGSGGGQVMTSTDGITWSAAGANPSAFNQAVAQGSNSCQWSAAAGKFAIPGDNVAGAAKVAFTVDGSSWSYATAAPLSSYALMSNILAAEAIGGFLGGLPYDSGFTPTPTIIGISEDAGATWTDEDTTESGLWIVGAWDDDSGTVVCWDANQTDTMLVGVFALPTVDGISPNHGPTAGGTSVTITGTNLQGMTNGDVLIGGVAATSVSPAVDGLSLTCDTPAHAGGEVDVVVLGAGTLDDAFTYESVESCRPNKGPTRGGQTVVIRGFRLDLATSVAFDGITVPADQWTTLSSTAIRALTPAHIGTGAVDVVVGSVGTGVGIYEYGGVTLPPIPVTSKMTMDNGKMHPDFIQWLTQVKKAIES